MTTHQDWLAEQNRAIQEAKRAAEQRRDDDETKAAEDALRSPIQIREFQAAMTGQPVPTIQDRLLSGTGQPEQPSRNADAVYGSADRPAVSYGGVWLEPKELATGQAQRTSSIDRDLALAAEVQAGADVVHRAKNRSLRRAAMEYHEAAYREIVR